MPLLIAVLPEFAAEVKTALLSANRPELAAQLDRATIDYCTHEPGEQQAYIYLVRPVAPPPSAGPVAEMLVFYQEQGFNVDIDAAGQLFGIELLWRPEIVAQLRAAKAL
ncbi:MAG: hypothetical protein ACKO7W_24375 [Elainella sp.]